MSQAPHLSLDLTHSPFIPILDSFLFQANAPETAHHTTPKPTLSDTSNDLASFKNTTPTRSTITTIDKTTTTNSSYHKPLASTRSPLDTTMPLLDLLIAFDLDVAEQVLRAKENIKDVRALIAAYKAELAVEQDG